MKLSRLSGVAASLALATAAPAAWGQHPAPAPSAGKAVDIQGADAWRKSPGARRYYDATVAAFAKGPDKVDAAAFQKTSVAIFRELAVYMGVQPEMMVEHLKLIPGQTIQIVKDDPKVLDSYDAFLDAIFGPR